MSDEIQGQPDEAPSASEGTADAQVGGSVLSSIGAGAIAGAGAGAVAYMFTEGRMTFAIWIVAYILVISGAKHKWLATAVFIPAAILTTSLMQSLGLSE